VAAQKGSIREQIDRRHFQRPMKQALRRLLTGQSYREAAEAERVDHAYLWRAAGSIGGLREAHLRAWRDRWGAEFPPEWRQHLAALGTLAIAALAQVH